MHSFQQQQHSFIQTAQIQQLVKNWDGLHTSTTNEQENNEEKCAFYWIDAGSLSEEERLKRFKTGYWDASGKVVFMRDAHIAYLRRHCGELGTRYMSQASRYSYLRYSFMNSKPWLYFHVLNSLDLLNSEDISLYEGATASVNACYCGGGYAGSELEVGVVVWWLTLVSSPDDDIRGSEQSGDNEELLVHSPRRVVLVVLVVEERRWFVQCSFEWV